MGRFFAPILAFAAAAYVYTQNQGAENEFVYLFPLNNIFSDPVEAGQRSWQLLLLVGVLWLITDLRALMKARGQAEEPAADAE